MSNKWYKENKDKIYVHRKKYRKENKDKISAQKKQYGKNNRDKINNKNTKYRKNNPHIFAWRSVLRNSLKRLGTKKSASTIELLGYSAEQLRDHIASLFQEGMSWENHGEWHIDHKVPVVKFSPDTPPSVVNDLSNLQPLWAKDNLSKGNRIAA